MYAIIESGGKQYKVSSGDTVKVDKLSSEPGVTVTIEKVLLVVDGTRTVVGTPYITGAAVKAEVMGTEKAQKVLVYKKRARRVYEKIRGHRQQFTSVKITEVSFGG
ncbi:MAG TPA: 50S ribosomal protein L21 [Nitrospiraceae bacterium]|jgi:large subunit ribosomal protein L21|nr:50S ribosomal protein L21 [Nitrospiraceae bacterium]